MALNGDFSRRRPALRTRPDSSGCSPTPSPAVPDGGLPIREGPTPALAAGAWKFNSLGDPPLPRLTAGPTMGSPGAAPVFHRVWTLSLGRIFPTRCSLTLSATAPPAPRLTSFSPRHSLLPQPSAAVPCAAWVRLALSTFGSGVRPQLSLGGGTGVAPIGGSPFSVGLTSPGSSRWSRPRSCSCTPPSWDARFSLLKQLPPASPLPSEQSPGRTMRRSPARRIRRTTSAFPFSRRMHGARAQAALGVAGSTTIVRRPGAAHAGRLPLRPRRLGATTRFRWPGPPSQLAECLPPSTRIGYQRAGCS